MGEIVILYTTWPDADTAQAVAAEAVAERLAACVNVLAPMTSIYRWEGAVERAAEIPALFKTTAERQAALRDLILLRHPHETPAVLGLPVDPAGSNPAFFAWLEKETGGPGAGRDA